MKRFIFALSLGLVLSIVSVGNPVDLGGAGWIGFELSLNEADARGRGGHRGGARRGPSRSAHSSMRRPSSRPSTRPSTRPSSPSRGNRDVNVNKRDINVNKNVNVDVDTDRRRYGAGLVAGAVVAGAFISTLPAGCNTVNIDGVRYYNCGSTYYVESYQGTEVVYEPVDAPQ